MKNIERKYITIFLLLILSNTSYSQINTNIDTWKDKIEVNFNNLIEFQTKDYSFTIDANIEANILKDKFMGWSNSLVLKYKNGNSWYETSSNPLFNPVEDLKDFYIKIDEKEPIKIKLKSGSHICHSICALKLDRKLDISIVPNDLFNSFLTADEIRFRFYYENFNEETKISGQDLNNLSILLNKLIEIQNKQISNNYN